MDYETAPQYNVILNMPLYHERLMDMSARKYSKTQGAFTSVDALWGMALGTSAYIYSHHDPINFADPSGYAGTPVGGGGTGTGGTGGTPGGKTGGAWPYNPFMLDAFSSDESRAITSQGMIDRLGWNATLVAQQPQYAAKSKSGLQAIPAHAQTYMPSTNAPQEATAGVIVVGTGVSTYLAGAAGATVMASVGILTVFALIVPGDTRIDKTEEADAESEPDSEAQPLSLQEQAEKLREKHGRAEVILGNGSRLHLDGDAHGPVATPHVHELEYNTNPKTGITYPNKIDKPRPATQKDLDEAAKIINGK